jgi:hypothetical protein
MHPSGSFARKQPGDRRFVETFFADDNEAPVTRFVSAPRPVKILLKAISDALDEEPHRFATHLDKAFDPQDIVALRDLGQSVKPSIAIGDCANFKGGAVEIVVIVLAQSIVVRWPLGKIVLGGGIEAEQDGGVDPAFAGGHDFHRAGDKRRDVGGDAALLGVIDEIGLIEHDEIGA